MAGKRESRLVEIVRLFENSDSPPTAKSLAGRYNVSAQIIRSDVRYLRKAGYLPSSKLAELRRRYKPRFVKGGVM